jgi:SAM-dependent methyltransferase
MKVLEVGCGRGDRCLDIAGRGARRVIGIDPLTVSVECARAKLADRPNLAPVVDFRTAVIHDLEEDGFDAIVSENTFDHIVDVPETLAAIRDRLRPGGQALLGFGPLWHAPDGDHGWIRQALPFGRRFLIPWGHLLFPRRWALRRLERMVGKPARDTIDWPYLALNQLAAADFHRLFLVSGLRVKVFRTNESWGRRGKVFGPFAKLPIIGKCFNSGIYAILSGC